MNHGLKTTFELLAKTENEAAVQVLLPALDSSDRAIQEAALRAILDRRSLSGQHEIVRRMHTIDDGWKAIINERRGRMTQALRDALLDGNDQMCVNACQAILWFHEYDLIPALVNIAEDAANRHTDLAARTLLHLSELLYDELASPRDYRLRRDPQLVRKNVTGSLEESVKRFVKHHRSEVIEAFLLLAGRDNSTLVQILLDPRNPSYLPVIQMLTHSGRQGVIRLVLGYLDDPTVPSSLLTVVAHRSDRAFVEKLLRKVGHKPSAGAQANLKHIESISWLKGELSLLDELDDAGQYSAVQLMAATAIKPAAAWHVVAHLVRYGKPGGRRAAVTALANFSGAEANALCLQAQDDADPQVQALAIAQLRPRGIPGALATLLERIESPHHVVRDAARKSLAEFNFKRFLAAYEMLEDEVRRSTGLLVKRIDAQAIPQLREELGAASGRRRKRALAIARTLDVVAAVEDKVRDLLAEDDHLIRAEAAEALGDCDTPTARAALEMALEDNSNAVREAVTDSLLRLEQRGHRHNAATLPWGATR